MTSFKLVDFLAYLQAKMERAKTVLMELGITEVIYVGLPSNIEDQHFYLSVSANQFPWDQENIDCWDVNIYRREAQCRIEFVREKDLYRIGTVLSFDDIPNIKQIPANLLQYIHETVVNAIANREKTYEGVEPPFKKAWLLDDPDLVKARKDADVIEHHMKLRT